MIKATLTDRVTQVRVFRFVIVGGVVAATHFAILATIRKYLNPNIAFTGAYVAATAIHYSLNKKWALPSERSDHGRQFGEYLIVVALSYLVNIGLFMFARSILAMGVMWAAVFAVPPATLVVFLLLNYRVFRGQAKPKAFRQN